jgi:predicted RND superfamily exporter protein
MIAITKGSISTIALAAGCVILGIGINYALHFINHYKHSHSIKETIGDLIEPSEHRQFYNSGFIL